MKIQSLVYGVLVATALAFVGSQALSQEQPDQKGMQRWMESMKSGEQHKKLEALIGKWDTEMSIDMGGAPVKSTGTAEGRWLFPGKWVAVESKGTMMGMPVSQFQVIGYDNFKQKYVWTAMDSMQTTISHAEGSFLQDGKVLQMWGLMDEPITGEHDKTVKYTLRLTGPDEHTFEVHDLQIDEPGRAVVKVVSKRRKE